MKKPIIITVTTGLTILLFSFITFISCNKQHQKANSSENRGNGKEVSILGEKFTVRNWQSNSRGTTKKETHNILSSNVDWENLYTDLYEVDAIDMQNFVDDLNLNISGDFDNNSDLPATLILYVNEYSASLDFNDIIGISKMTYQLNGSGNVEALNNYYYTVSTGVSTNVTNLQEDISVFTSWDIASLYMTSIGSGTSSAPYIIKFQLTPETTYASGITYKPLGEVIYENNYIMDGGKGCGPDASCEKGFNNQICRPASYGAKPTCDVSGGDPIGPICPMDRANSFISPDIDDDDAYDFRDFLGGYTIGQKYIKYYYEIGYMTAMFNIITSGNVTSFTPFIESSIDVANTIMNGNNNDIVITQTYYDDAISMINTYKGIVSNTEVHNRLDDIAADLLTYKNKTRSELLGMID